MTKRNLPAGKAGKIIYWISNIWLALGMLLVGAGQFIKMKAERRGVKKNERASFPIFIMLVAISIFTAFYPIGISGQTDQPADPSSYGVTPGRLGASLGALLSLIGLVIGVLALARPAGRFGTASGRLGAIVALVAGLIGMALGGLVAATSGGRIGTGGGLAGAIVALVVGLIAMALGGLALSKSRHTG